MPIHFKDQRIGVFVDVQNMYYSAKSLYNAKVNFMQILKAGAGNRCLIRAIAYVIKADIKEEQNFFDALEKIGFEVKAKDLQIFAGGAKKGDWDIGLAMDTIELAPKLDTIVIVSGDGDYVPLVRHLRHALGCRIEAIAFGKSCSGKLKEECDSFIDLDSDKRRFLIFR
ncbi:NYN domain-containing protein [Candidatus Woesearchaeota archaeon]|nr:NYN domain-containing protein [Candidatus Woesearchaeota archaeon]